MREEKRFLKGIVVALILICNVLTSCFASFNISLASETENKEVNTQENKEFDQTEVITETNFINKLLYSASGITSIDLTGLATGTDANHTHIYEQKYDTTKHWEQCIICGNRINENSHSLVTVGEYGCQSRLGYQYQQCSCGYSKQLAKAPHTPSEWKNASDRAYHYKHCTYEDCPSWTNVEHCYDSGGEIGCKANRTGTCLVCGDTRYSNQHSLGQVSSSINNKTEHGYVGSGLIVCTDCKIACIEYNYTTTQIGKNRIQYSFSYKTENGYEINNPSEISITAAWGYGQYTALESKNYSYNNGTYTFSGTFTFDVDKFSAGTWSMLIQKFNTEWNGYTHNFEFGVNWLSDSYQPQYNSANIDYYDYESGFARKAILKATFIEEYDNICYIRVLDSDKTTVIADWKSATKNGTTFTTDIDITDEVKGTKQIYVQAKDTTGNTTDPVAINISNIDSKSPTLVSQSGNTTTWAKSKEITYTVNDGGIGSASIAFNNQSDFQLASQSGNNYSRTYNFYGDVYSSVTGALYIKDALGNIRTEKVTISKLDGTAPTITGTSIKNNVITVTAHDQKSGIGEGSGVSSYRYMLSSTKLTNPSITTSNSTQVTGKTTGTGTFTVNDIAETNYIYVAAVDAVGNIGTAVEVPVPKLTLGNTIDLSAEEGKGGVKLTWTIDNSADKVYSIYQQGETTWGAISEKISGTTMTTSTSKDVAVPNKPTVTVEGIENNKIKISQSATDNGSTYSFYAEAYDKTNSSILLSRSNQVTGTISTGVKGYYYVTDNNEENDFDIANAKYVSEENLELDIEHNGEYVHIKAEDNAGNVSEESSALIWIESQATVDPNEGNLEGDENSRVLVGLVGKTVDLGTPTRTGYTFLGWSATAGTINGTIYTYALEAGIVTANWQINDYKYTVEYYYNGIKDKTVTETGIATYMTQVESYIPKVKTGYSFDTVENLPLTITEKEETNVIRVYYKTNTSVTKTVSYTILFYKDGVLDLGASRTIRKNVQVLLPNQVQVDKNLIDENKYDGYELEKTSPSPVPDVVDTGSVINVYYVSKKAEAVVKYVDKYTGEEIAEEKIIEGKVHSEYNITGSEKEIDGYTLVESPENITGTYTQEREEFIYYYAKNSNVIVKYLEKDTNEVLANEESIIKYQGESYETNFKEIENYELVVKPENATGTVERENIEVIYYYLQKTKVTINHVDIISDEILETETIDGKVGDKYETFSKDISDYILVTENEEGNSILPENATGEMTKEEIIVNYYYKHVSEGVIVKHIDKISGEILDNETIEGSEGDEYTTTPKEFDGYDLDETLLPENSQGTMSKELIEVKYYYVRKAQVKVQYLDRNTNEEIASSELLEGYEGDSYTTTPKEIEEYYLVESMMPENITGTMTKEEITVTYYYAKKSAGVLEKHINENTKEILEEKLHESLIGDDYKISPKEFEDYDLDTTKLPENSQGKMTEELIEVDYYYIRKAYVKVEYIDELANEVITQDVISGHEGDTYKTSPKEIKNYILDEAKLPENAEGIMEITENEDGIVTSEIVVKYYYKKISAGILEKHIDIKTEEVIQDEVYEGMLGDRYKTSPKDYEEYDLVTTKLPKNAEGTMTEELIEVDYYYIRKSTVRVEYVDNETGKKLVEDTIIEGHEDDEYKTEPKRIKDYTLDEDKLPENAEGTMKVTRSKKANEEAITEIVVTYYYDKDKNLDGDGNNQDSTGKPSDNENNNNSGNNSSNNGENTNTSNNENSSNNTNNNSNGGGTTIIISDSSANSNTSSNSSNNATSSTTLGTSSSKTPSPSTGDIEPVAAIGAIILVGLANIIQVIINKRKKR